MSSLNYRNGVLHIEDVNVEAVVDEFSTPIYIYSKSEIERNLTHYQKCINVWY
jgi:diaminopimelate decarboxylase